jgi:hypothetical protein
MRRWWHHPHSRGRIKFTLTWDEAYLSWNWHYSPISHCLSFSYFSKRGRRRTPVLNSRLLYHTFGSWFLSDGIGRLGRTLGLPETSVGLRYPWIPPQNENHDSPFFFQNILGRSEQLAVDTWEGWLLPFPVLTLPLTSVWLFLTSSDLGIDSSRTRTLDTCRIPSNRTKVTGFSNPDSPVPNPNYEPELEPVTSNWHLWAWEGGSLISVVIF